MALQIDVRKLHVASRAWIRFKLLCSFVFKAEVESRSARMLVQVQSQFNSDKNPSRVCVTIVVALSFRFWCPLACRGSYTGVCLSFLCVCVR